MSVWELQTFYTDFLRTRFILIIRPLSSRRYASALTIRSALSGDGVATLAQRLWTPWNIMQRVDWFFSIYFAT